MDLNNLPVFGVLRTQMDWLGQRQAVLAQNVANADTPGYVARDVERPDFEALISRLTANSQSRGGEVSISRMPEPQEVSLSGNTVTLDQQMMMVAETASQYELTTSLYTKQIGLLRMALGNGR